MFLVLLLGMGTARSAWADDPPPGEPAPTAPAIEPPPLPTPPIVFPTEAPPPPPEPPTNTPVPPPTDTPVPPTDTPTPAPTATHTPSGALLTAIAVSSQVPTATPTATHPPTVTATASASATGTATPSWLPPGPECVQKPGKTVLKLDVPYIHQVMDVGGADGNWACGPTSVVMVLAYYGKLEPWRDYMLDPAAIEAAAKATAGPSTTPRSWAAEPSQAALDYAPYVTGVFTAGGHLYNDTARDPRGNKVAGLYGNIAPTGYADWSRMRAVFERQGLQTQHVGASWNAVVAALKRGHPVLIGNDLTPEGHILVAVGYTNKNQLIVNDPYGNRFAPGYGGTMGKEVVYPWSCMRAQNALEVIGTYPPEPRPSRTPTATVTGTPTSTPTETATPTITPPATATSRVRRTAAPLAGALTPRPSPTTAAHGAYIAGVIHARERVPSALELAAPRLLGLSLLMCFAVGFWGVAYIRRGRGRTIPVRADDGA